MLACFLGAAAPLSAQKIPAEIYAACSKDIDAFCPVQRLDSFHTLFCLSGKKVPFSDACSSRMQLISNGYSELQTTCRQELAGVCASTKNNTLAALKCLWGNRDQSSEACRLSCESAHSQFDTAARTCQKEAALYCSGKEFGSRHARKCLKKNSAKLSAQCRQKASRWLKGSSKKSSGE
jgi:hypothetical protein